LILTRIQKWFCGWLRRPRRRKVLATPSSPIGLWAFPLTEKMRRGRRKHPAVTRRHRHRDYHHFRALNFGVRVQISQATQDCQAAAKVVFQICGPDVPFRLSALPIPGARCRRRRRRRQLRRANHHLSRLPPAFRRVHPPPAARWRGGTVSRGRQERVQPQFVAHRRCHSAIPAGG